MAQSSRMAQRPLPGSEHVTQAPEAVDMTAFAYTQGAPPAASAVIRGQPHDYRVHERCPVTPCGEGEHLWLEVEKTGLTTPQIAHWLAEAARIRPRDVGFSGLKDRRAVTTQWFSLAWPIRLADKTLAPDSSRLPKGGSARILEQCRHSRKLRRGTHDGNRFELTLRDVHGDRSDVEARLSCIARESVPNYFGAQRFGHDGRNLELAHALFAGKRLRRDKRGYALSAARSFLFNAVLDARVRGQTWAALLGGEAVMLDGSNSIFNADGHDAAELDQRLAAFDIHPSGPLPGRNEKALAGGPALELEQSILGDYPDLVEGLVNARVDAARRALRLAVRNMDWHWLDEVCLQLGFTLPAGGFATSVLREIATVTEPPPDTRLPSDHP